MRQKHLYLALLLLTGIKLQASVNTVLKQNSSYQTDSGGEFHISCHKAHNFSGSFNTDAPRKPMQPLTLLNFTVKQEGTTAVLNWTTLQETSSQYFIIERSRDGIQYENIDTLEAAGNSSTPVLYSISDQSPLNGFSTYRLKLVDYNGVSSYCRPISLIFAAKETLEIQVFPNPATASAINLSIPETEAESVSISITDALGKEHFSAVYNNTNTFYISETRELGSGVYYVHVMADGITGTSRLIITQ